MNISEIRKVFELAQKLNNPIDLSIGKPDFAVPKEIKEEAQKAIENDFNDYSLTVGVLELRKKVVEKLRRKNKIKTATENNTIITSAVSGGLSVVLPAIINSGDEVIIFDPYFVGYKQLVLLYGGVPKIVSKNENFSLNIKNIQEAVSKKTRAIIVNSPENPTGYVWTESELKEVARIAEKNNLYIISDEIYENFVYEQERPHFSIGSFYKKAITLGGFSKSYAMTGWRIGYIHLPSELVEEVIKVQQFTFVCAPTPLQYAALKAFEVNTLDFVKKYKKRRNFIFSKLKDKYEINNPFGSFYFFIKYPFDGDKFIKKCLENNLLVVPGSAFSEKNTHFRISFSSKNNDIKKAIEILNKIA